MKYISRIPDTERKTFVYHMNKLRILRLAVLTMLPLCPGFGQSIFTSTIHTIPVLITIPMPNGFSYGTGFYLSQSNHIFLVTASHVLFQIVSNNISDTLINSNAQLTCETEQPYGTLGLQLDLNGLLSKQLVKHHANRDIAAVEVAREKSGISYFNDLIQFKVVPPNAHITTYTVASDCDYLMKYLWVMILIC